MSLVLAVCYNNLLFTETFYLNSANANKLKRSSHLDRELYGFTSNSAHAEMFSTICAAVTHPENLTNSTQEPVLQTSERNLLTWHHRFHYQRCITFPALCILLLTEGWGGENCANNIQEKAIYLQPTEDSSKQSYVSFSSRATGFHTVWLEYTPFGSLFHSCFRSILKTLHGAILSKPTENWQHSTQHYLHT